DGSDIYYPMLRLRKEDNKQNSTNNYDYSGIGTIYFQITDKTLKMICDTREPDLKEKINGISEQGEDYVSSVLVELLLSMRLTDPQK
ncbi:MAG: hypothetical protein KJT03_22830, partial [Verrucomicrobiae bacterium]|nr:hypothetical protein [Verrucomicrobiae bacterium]